jgi:hypothetical protein
MPQTPQIGEDVTALMGGAGQSPPSAAPPVGADVTHLMQTPTFHTENQKDANGNAVVDPAALASALGVNMAGIDPSAAGHALLNVVKGWVDAGPHAVVEGLRDIWHGNYAKGAHGVITGAATTAAPMVAPELLPAIAAAPGAAALTAVAGYAGSAGASRLASAVGATPDQAALAGDVAGLGAGAAIAKVGVPALTKWSANRKALQMGADYMQSTRDIQAALGVKAEDVHRARPFLESVHANGIPIAGKEDAAQQLVKAADVAVSEIEQHVGDMVRQFPNAAVPPLQNAIIKRVVQMPGSSPADLAAARQVIREYGLDQPRSLPEADSLRIRLNAENRSLLEGSGVRQRTATLTNAAFVARQEAANQLRDGIYGALEQNGVEGIRDLRQSEGSILALRNAADPVTRGLRGESTVARTGTTSLARRVGQKVAQLGGAALGAEFGGPVGAAVGAEVGQSLTAGLTAKNMSKNELLERAFRQSFTSPPVMSVQGIPQSTAGGWTPWSYSLESNPAPQLPSGTRALPPGQ